VGCGLRALAKCQGGENHPPAHTVVGASLSTNHSTRGADKDGPLGYTGAARRKIEGRVCQTSKKCTGPTRQPAPRLMVVEERKRARWLTKTQLLESKRGLQNSIKGGRKKEEGTGLKRILPENAKERLLGVCHQQRLGKRTLVQNAESQPPAVGRETVRPLETGNGGQDASRI